MVLPAPAAGSRWSRRRGGRGGMWFGALTMHHTPLHAARCWLQVWGYFLQAALGLPEGLIPVQVWLRFGLVWWAAGGERALGRPGSGWALSLEQQLLLRACMLHPGASPCCHQV